MIDEKARKPEKVSYSMAWLYFLFILSLIIAWAIPIKIFIDNYFMPVEYNGPRDASAFVAVVYEGVSTKTNEVSPVLFKEHIETLRSNGYTPITLQDVKNFYYEGRKLPEKAILTTFDYSRKSSFFETRNVMKKNYWHGVMFLWMKPIIMEDPSALLWPYISQMARSDNWELGVQSYDGFQKIPTDNQGKSANFMTSKMWLDKENRFETLEEFKNRLMSDHLRSLDIVENKVGFRPSAYAYAYPYGDFGQMYRRSAQLKNVNMDLVESYYDLGFTSGNFPLNTIYTDPRRLNRMVVKNDMSADKLLTMLENAWPDNAETEIVSPILDSDKWVDDWGSKSVVSNVIVLGADKRSTGARMWLSGSNERKNFYAKINFNIVHGQFGIFLRGTPDEERCVYLGIDTMGNVWVRQKHVGLEFFTLSSARTIFVPNQWHELEIYLRDNLFGIMLDGKNVLQERAMLLGSPLPGMIGLSIWDKEPSKAEVQIGLMEIKGQKPALASWLYNEEEFPFFAHWIHKNGFKLTNLCPYWYSVRGSGYLQKSEFNTKLLTSLCRMYNLKFTPTIIVNDENFIYKLPLKDIMTQIDELKLDGLYLDLSSIQGFDETLLGTWLENVDTRLDEAQKEVLVRFPRKFLSWEILQPILASLTNIKVVTDNISVVDDVIESEVELVEEERVPKPSSKSEIPIAYHIDSDVSVHGELAKQNRILTLRRDGRSAFRAGDYHDALRLWKEWESLEPHDSTPPMLIGEAYVRLGELDKAYDSYAKSLDLDPGRVAFAMRIARLLEDMGREKEAIEYMNTYALLFPENVNVMLAQAKWLDRHGRPDESGRLLQKALKIHPDNFDLLVAMLLRATNSTQAESIMQKIVDIGQRKETYAQLATAIEKYDLLTLPEGYALADMCAKIANDPDIRPELAERFKKFTLIEEPIYEYITDGTLSDKWSVNGVIGSAGVDKIELSSDLRHNEAYLKLEGSARIQDGWIEVDLSRYTGEFWLVGHRTPTSYVRFGIATNNMVYLQVRKDGITYSSRSSDLIEYGPNIGRMRLEIRGNGAQGYINGEPISTAPVALLPDASMGSWGIISYSSEPGAANVELGYIAAGPLPFNLAVIDMGKIGTDHQSQVQNVLDMLKQEKQYLSAIAPNWYSLNLEGELYKNTHADDKLLKIFARYYGIRFTPAIRVNKLTNISIEYLKKYAQENHFNGFVLVTNKMPTQKWFDNLDTKLIGSSVEIYVMVENKSEGKVIIRAGGVAKDLLDKPNGNSELNILSPYDPATGEQRKALVAEPEEPTILYY